MRSPYDGLSAEGYDRRYRDRELVARILGYFRTERRAMLMVSTAIVAGSLIGVALPIVLSRTIDQVATAGFSLGAVVAAVTAILLLSLLDWGFSALDRTVAARAVSNVVLRLRRAVFDAVLGHDLSFFDRYPTGGIVSRVLSDTQAFSEVVTMTIGAVSEVVLTVLIFAYLFTIDVPLTLVALLLVPAMFTVSLGFRRLSRRVVTQSRRSVADVSGHVHETMSGIAVAKSFRKEQLLYDQFAPVNQRSFRLGWRHDVVFSSFTPGAGHRRRAGLRGPGVRGRAARGARRRDHRRVVPVPADRPPAVVPARHDRRVLEPVPARPGRRGTRIRPDRHRRRRLSRPVPRRCRR